MFRLLTVFALLLLCNGAIAQLQPGDPPLPGNEPPVVLEFRDSDVRIVLDFYEKLTGKRTVRDPQVQGPVYVVVTTPVPKEEAQRIIEIALLINGFTLVPTEDPKIVKVVGLNKNPKNAGIPMFSDLSQLPEGEQVVTYLHKLRFADPVELAQTLGQAIPPNPVYGASLVPLPKSQALLITENTVIIRGIVRLIREIDLPPAEVISEFITLERADAKDVLEKLEKIFEKAPSATGAPGSPGVPAGGAGRAPRPAAVLPDGTPVPQNATVEATGPNTVEIDGGSTLTEDSIIIGKIKLTADVRTNRIHIVTRPVNMPFVRRLLEEFDSDVKFGEPHERSLRFVRAGEVLDAVIKAIQDPGAKDEGGVGQTAGGTGRQTGRQGQTGGGIFGNNDDRGGGIGGSSGGGGDFNVSEGLSTDAVETTPTAVTVGNTRIIADRRANKIIVLGNREVKDKIFSLLDRLDVRAPQVMLHTVIGQLQLNDNESFGVDYILRKGGQLGAAGITPGTGAGPGTGNGGNAGGNTGLVNISGAGIPSLNFNALLNQRNIQQIATVGATGLSGFFTAGNTLDVIVNALESTNRFKVTARPKVYTSNNEKAIIANGQEIAVPTQTLTSLTNVNQNSDNAAVSSSIQFKRVALQLEVVPLINSEREVALDILQKLDEVAGSTTIGGNNIPTIATRYIKTHVSVPNEATLVLGGLITQRDSKARSGIPYLSRIPVVGALFRTTTKQKTREELVILIRPVVTMEPDESIRLREREQEYLQIEPDLESTVYPPGIRDRVPPVQTLRATVPVLREKALAPGFKK